MLFHPASLLAIVLLLCLSMLAAPAGMLAPPTGGTRAAAADTRSDSSRDEDAGKQDGGKKGTGKKGSGGEKPGGGGEGDEEPEEPQFKPPPPPVKNLTPPADFDDKKAGDLLLLLDEFTNAEKVNSGGEPMKKVIANLEKNRKRLESPLLSYLLGKGAHNLRDSKKAAAELTKALEKNPKFYEAEAELGSIAWEEGEFAQALGHYQKALEIYGYYLPALDGGALGHIRTGTPAQAGPLLELAQRIDETDERAGLIQELAEHLKGPGWAETFTAESEHYLVKSSKSEKAAQNLASLAEKALTLYRRFFPMLTPGERKYEIYLYDEQDCARGGVDTGESGLYSVHFGKLKICDIGEAEDTLRVLKRQAIVQALLLQRERFPCWFVRACQEFFEPANLELAGEKDYWVRPNSMQQPLLGTSIKFTRYLPFQRYMLQSDKEYLKEEDRNRCQGWGVMFFCLQGGNANYQKALTTYAEACLRQQSPEQAFADSFGKIDLKKFETEWRKYLIEELPKISKGR